MAGAAERKRRQRRRDRQDGIVEVTVRVPANRADELRAVAAGMVAAHQPLELPGQTGLPGIAEDVE